MGSLEPMLDIDHRPDVIVATHQYEPIIVQRSRRRTGECTRRNSFASSGYSARRTHHRRPASLSANRVREPAPRATATEADESRSRFGFAGCDDRHNQADVSM